MVLLRVLDDPTFLSIVCLFKGTLARQEDGNHRARLAHNRLGFVGRAVRRLRHFAKRLAPLIHSLPSQGLGAKSAQCQTNDKKPRFKMTIPTAEIRSSPARK